MKYNNVRTQMGRSMFDLSYEKKFDGDMGKLYPVQADMVVPGDVIQLGAKAVLRGMPSVAPILHEVNMYAHSFFVPLRILWDEWVDFITGGDDGSLTPTMPKWEPTDMAVGSLWDLMGFPVGIDPQGFYPMDFIKRCYNLIYNEYYRDRTYISEVDITTSEVIFTRAWEKDFFTSALPWQQRGTAPSLPITGTTSALYNSVSTTGGAGPAQYSLSNPSNPYDAQTKTLLEANTVDLSSASTFDIADLRLASQIQRWMEINATGGVEYGDFLENHFGQSPRDERLQRPEYIGGGVAPIIVSEVLQTSETTVNSAQGNLAGHAIAGMLENIGSYRVKEYGIIMTIMSVMPKPAYEQGINRQWIADTKYDFYFPEFANLSEQAVLRGELYASAVSGENNTLFGYQARYNEMRIKQNQICGQLRYGQAFDYWHLGRYFSSAPALNQTFLECVPRKDYLAVPSESAFIVSWGNIIKAFRPLPFIADPSLM